MSFFSDAPFVTPPPNPNLMKKHKPSKGLSSDSVILEGGYVSVADSCIKGYLELGDAVPAANVSYVRVLALKTLEVAMDSIIDLMKAVESKENDVEQAKVDAKRGCSDILDKVDEVKHTLLRAKEANDMHAGEVNAERAILATELRELQLRLFTLSDETSLIANDEVIFGSFGTMVTGWGWFLVQPVGFENSGY